MSRSHPETEAVNADSFLDIVASVVSIMIIMVVMVGLKIKNTPVDDAAISLPAQGLVEPAGDTAAEETIQADVVRVRGEIGRFAAISARRKEDCDAMVQEIAALEQQLHAAGRSLEDRSQQAGGLRRKADAIRARVSELERQRAAVETSARPSVAIESYPTPLSRFVVGRELHFQLHHGRLAFVPLESFLEEMKSDARRKVYKLRDAPEMTETLEPQGGFRFRYTMERVDKTPETDRETHRGGTYVQLKRWTLIPESGDPGEPVEKALTEGSAFRQRLSDPGAKDATITIWTYPDSFAAFRQIKKELYHLGFAVAARPLPEGVLMSGSPDGTKSAAE